MLKDGEKGVIIQRDKQTYAVAPHIPCGMLTPEMMRRIADVAEQFACAAIKITGEGRIALIGLREEQVEPVWAALGMNSGRVVGLCVRGIKACPGNTYCKRGVQDSLKVGLELDRRYHGRPMPGKMKLAVSGCLNQCAESNFRDIGLVGLPGGWKVLIGGSGGAKAEIGQPIAEGLSDEQAIAAVDRLIDYFAANARANDRMGRLIARVGLEQAKQAIGT